MPPARLLHKASSLGGRRPGTAATVPELAALRARVRQIEQNRAAGGSCASSLPRTLDIPGIEPALQPPALAPATFQEVVPASAKDRPAAAAFALALIRQLLQGAKESPEEAPEERATLPLLWCQTAVEAKDFGRLYPPGLMPWGLAPGRLLLVEASRDKDILWAMEEGLRSAALAAVVGELGAGGLGTASLTATRRLALAAQQSGCPCLLLRNGDRGASAARTRWRIAGAPSRPGPLDPRAPGEPSWRAELVRCPQGRPAAWTLEWSHETDSFHLAAAMVDRPAAARRMRHVA